MQPDHPTDHPTPTPRARGAALATSRQRQRHIIWTVSIGLHALGLVALWIWFAVPEVPEVPTRILASFTPAQIVEEPETPPERHEPLEIPPELMPTLVIEEPPLETREDEFAEVEADAPVAHFPVITTLSAAALRKPRPKLPDVTDMPPTASQPEARPSRTRAQPRRAPPARGGTLTLVRRPNVQRFYPLQARERGIEGETIVLIEVDGMGHVVSAKVRTSSGYVILDAAAVRVAYAHLFAPGMIGRAVLPVRFRLIG